MPACFLDLDRHTKRVFQDAGEFARLFRAKVAGDLRAAAVDGTADTGGALHLAVQKDGELTPGGSELLGKIAENLGAGCIKSERHSVALLVVERESAGDVVTGKVGPALHEKLHFAHPCPRASSCNF